MCHRKQTVVMSLIFASYGAQIEQRFGTPQIAHYDFRLRRVAALGDGAFERCERVIARDLHND